MEREEVRGVAEPAGPAAGPAVPAGPAAPSAPRAATGAGVLSLRGFGVVFEGSRVPASAEVDLDLVPGRVLALVGESGSGKSVTAMGALGLLPSTAAVSGSATIRPSGDVGAAAARIELVGASRSVLDEVRGAVVGTVFQEPTTALDPLETIASHIGEAVRAHEGRSSRLSRAALHERVLGLLALAGLGRGEQAERIARSYPHQLSGGQLQRACIALAMACEPRVLIADEPTTALDVTVQAEILDLLRSLTGRGVAVLLITHDMGVVADIADDVAVMRHGRIVERGSALEVFHRPQHPYTRELLAAVPRLESLRGPQEPGDDGAASPVRQAAVRDGEPAVAGAGSPERPVVAERADGPGPAGDPAPARADEPVVAVSGLDVVYRNGRRSVHAVHDVSLAIGRGEVLGLVGESGSGKSTIAGTLTGLVPIASGSVRVCGVEVAGARRRDLLPARRATGVVFQNPASSLNPRRTVGSSIAEPMVVHGGSGSRDRRARVRELLDAVRLPASMADRYPHEMSGGQRQRVAIARALALDPALVIADEPTSALDVSVQAVVLDLLRELQDRLGFACLFVSHDLTVVDAVASRTVVLSKGRVIEEGPTAQVLSQPREDYTRRLVAAVPVPDPEVQAERRRRRLAA